MDDQVPAPEPSGSRRPPVRLPPNLVGYGPDDGDERPSIADRLAKRIACILPDLEPGIAWLLTQDSAAEEVKLRTLMRVLHKYAYRKFRTYRSELGAENPEADLEETREQALLAARFANVLGQLLEALVIFERPALIDHVRKFNSLMRERLGDMPQPAAG